MTRFSILRAIVGLALVLLATACRTVSVPPGNLPFATREGDALISGCFAEQGEAEDENQKPFLSNWLWPDVAGDSGVTVVSFQAAADGALVIKALAGQTVVRERTIPASDIRDGCVALGGGFWFSPFRNQTEEPPPLVGPYSEHTVLGLDTAGDLKLRRSGWVCGLVFLVVPVALSHDEQYRFHRASCPSTSDSGE